MNRKKKIAYVFQEIAAEKAHVAEEENGPQKKYSIGEVLGTGNFAVVKFGVERATGTRVAIKIIDKKRFMAQAASRKDKILDEVHILKELNHPNIIKIFDVFDTEKALYIVLELVTGGDLLEFILETRSIPEDRARDLFLQVSSAVAYLHGRGVAHRDLKPENLLLLDKKHDTIKVTDFGLSKVLDEGSYTKTICGTPQYLG